MGGLCGAIDRGEVLDMIKIYWRNEQKLNKTYIEKKNKIMIKQILTEIVRSHHNEV